MAELFSNSRIEVRFAKPVPDNINLAMSDLIGEKMNDAAGEIAHAIKQKFGLRADVQVED